MSRSKIPPIDYVDRLRAGINLPSGNPVAEPEIRAMLPRGVSALFTRLVLRGTADRELMAMLDSLEDAARLVADAGVATMVFYCTANSTFAPQLGDEIRARTARASGVDAFATSEALAAAFRALEAQRVVLLTPYVEAVHTREIAFLESLGIEVVGHANLGLDTNTEMERLTPDELLAWAIRRTDAHCVGGSYDAVFLSCTALRSGGIIAALEARTDRPVVTSNQAMVWHLLRRNGVEAARPAFGRLFG